MQNRKPPYNQNGSKRRFDENQSNGNPNFRRKPANYHSRGHLVSETHFKLDGMKQLYRGKVRDVYTFEDKVAIIATDRISAFDVVLPRFIPYKGQVLNQTSEFFMQLTASIVPNWLESCPDTNVSFGIRCKAIPLEMVIRGYLCGSAWRSYKDGRRIFNNQKLPDGLRENDPLPFPIVTPTTKGKKGQHDQEITTDEILKLGVIPKNLYDLIEHYTKLLYQAGGQISERRGLILADTKYEFGVHEGKVFLIDELHTPDSSRFFNKDGFMERQAKGQQQVQRSKEMVRQWLMKQGFMGRSNDVFPRLTEEWVNTISEEYISLYEQLTGKTFIKNSSTSRMKDIEEEVNILIKNTPKTVSALF